MTEPDFAPEPNDMLDADTSDALAALLGDADLWEDNDPADEAAILAAIGEMAAPTVGDPIDESPLHEPTTGDVAPISNVTPISSARRWVGPFVAGIAAAVVLFAGFSVFAGSEDRNGIELALTATDLAPAAEGLVEIVATPNGTVLLLDVSGLPPAPEGSYYEAWVRQDAAIGVSAGTFHLRGGGGEIELWAGVTVEDYPLFTITIQDEADPVSSGQVVLRGLVGE